MFVFIVFVFLVVLFETGPLCSVAQAPPELTLYPGIACNSGQAFCLCHPRAAIDGVSIVPG